MSTMDSLDRDIARARTFTCELIRCYWTETQKVIVQGHSLPIRDTFQDLVTFAQLNETELNEIEFLSKELSEISLIEGSFRIGEIYTAKLPKEYRSQYGIYFTPPALTARLLDNAESSGIDWSTSNVIDPACGGGAFLAPVALRMKDALRKNGYSDTQIIEHISTHLKGKELDPFSAWMSQVFLELALIQESTRNKHRLPQLVQVTDTLKCPEAKKYDLVIGNPPYSKVKLDKGMRKKYERSLYGHANLYGLFTDKALSMLSPNGVLAYVTPTSFLSGQYFKKLRHLLSVEAHPLSIDFIESRKGVFSGVLQETLLCVFKKTAKPFKKAISSTVRMIDEQRCDTLKNGTFTVKIDSPDPWLIPRNQSDVTLLDNATKNHSQLNEYGYKVSTGPLVWNRHKDQIVDKSGKKRLPLVWSECVLSDGTFVHKSDRKNHKPWFEVIDGKDDWLIIDKPCLLLQRTTAKEQSSRLITAMIPEPFIERHGGAVIENHLNMIRPIDEGRPVISVEVLQRILKSPLIDSLFRAMNGSVAVSAYELEALPLPPINKALIIQQAILDGKTDSIIEKMIKDSYSEQFTKAA